MKVIKKYWKEYLEQLWYLFMLYGFIVVLDWKTGEGLDIFRPITIIYYLILPAFAMWLIKKLEGNKS